MPAEEQLSASSSGFWAMLVHMMQDALTGHRRSAVRVGTNKGGGGGGEGEPGPMVLNRKESSWFCPQGPA